MATERQEWIWEEYRQDFAVVQGEGERGGKGKSQISSWAISSESTVRQREAADEGVKTKCQLCSRWVKFVWWTFKQKISLVTGYMDLEVWFRFESY